MESYGFEDTSKKKRVESDSYLLRNSVSNWEFRRVFWDISENYYDQALCAMGDNDFNVGHTGGVTVQQRAGTSGRQVKCDQEASKKAWDYLAASPSDSEEDQSTLCFYFPATLFLPRKCLGFSLGPVC